VNVEELRKVLEELGKLQQGKKSATEYFLKLEQLADIVEIDLNSVTSASGISDTEDYFSFSCN
jgi:predicted alpha/beta-fold hydrolase